MTHRPETSLEAALVDYFEAQPEVEYVESQRYLGEPYWFIDVYVEYPWTRLAIEVENGWDTVRDGIGQAVGYAGDPSEPSAVPMVVVPAEHVDGTEIQWYRGQGVLVRGFDQDEGRFVDD